MSKELLPIELELMSLFDRDISPEKRAALIEKLQAHPDLLEKYSVYLHIQDIELAPTPPLPDPVRHAVLKAAQRHSQKVKWRERLGMWFGWILQPAVAAPAMVCLAFLAGYQLLESPKDTGSLNANQELGKKRIDQAKNMKLAVSTGTEAELAEPVATELNGSGDPARRALELGKKLNQVGGLGGLSGLDNTPRETEETVSDNDTIVPQREVQRRVVDALIQDQNERTTRQLKPRLAADGTTDGTEPLKRSEPAPEVAAESPTRLVARSRPAARRPQARTRRARAGSAPRAVPRTASVNQPARNAETSLELAVTDPVMDTNTIVDAISETQLDGEAAPATERSAAPRTLHSARRSRGPNVRTITSQERADFDRFVASLSPEGSLDAVASSRLLRMAEIAMKIREYPKARQWLMYIIRREDSLKTKATTMLDQLRRQLED